MAAAVLIPIPEQHRVIVHRFNSRVHQIWQRCIDSLHLPIKRRELSASILEWTLVQKRLICLIDAQAEEIVMAIGCRAIKFILLVLGGVHATLAAMVSIR